MNPLTSCPAPRPANRHSAPRLPSQKPSHPACPACGTPVITFKHCNAADGGKTYRVACPTCCRFFEVCLRITRDLRPAANQQAQSRSDSFLACPYCGGALKAYSGRRASELSTERYVRCDQPLCVHPFVCVYEFVAEEVPDPVDGLPLRKSLIRSRQYPLTGLPT